jgi:peptidoglycan/xylan/chitin deacetylase (PgdA/CDA1 family)
MYHSVAPNEVANHIDPKNRISPDLFDQQMGFLSKYRHVVSLSCLIEKVSAGEALPDNSVAITFDDGYLDNLTVAAPILQSYNLPSTIFLATGYVGRAESQWADVLHSLFETRRVHTLHLPRLDCHNMNLLLTEQRMRARKLIHLTLLEANYQDRTELLSEIALLLKTDMHLHPRLTMNWAEVRELNQRYPMIEIGGHTRDHIDLKNHCNESAYTEIDGCAEDIKRELGFHPKLFSFPYGRSCEQTKQYVKKGSWVSAMGANRKIHVNADTDLYSTGRINAPRTMTELRFKTCRAYPSVFKAVGMGLG